MSHEIGIWLGALRPRTLALTGRLADGWVPSLSYAPPDVAAEMHARIDEGAEEAGRRPANIRRLYNVMGEITDGPATELLHGPPDHWVETLTGFAVELGFDTFVFWPSSDPAGQTARFAQEVAPGVRDGVEQARGRTAA